ncbi:MAG: 16S rRNA (cytosine(967)-C(5))-methyltransferase RsmB [Xanthomonadaceae bacterium]|nr:16S rRNA (cytosine(967)-C(5))-methyltransferase RsmB [Xanthomonadaceae bacterium]
MSFDKPKSSRNAESNRNERGENRRDNRSGSRRDDRRGSGSKWGNQRDNQRGRQGGFNRGFNRNRPVRKPEPVSDVLPFETLMTIPRYVAVHALSRVLGGDSLADILDRVSEQLSDQDRRFAHHLLYGALREYDYLDDVLDALLKTPIKDQEREVRVALILALFEVTEMATADYAGVHSWVELLKGMDKAWATGLMNAILRGVLRDGMPEPKGRAGRYNLPQWLTTKLEKNWKRPNLEKMSETYREHAVMTLRVNPRFFTRDIYLFMLRAEGIEAYAHQFMKSAIVLDRAINVHDLPHFDKGAVTVQDASAQLAATLLSPEEGETILDACAAPGGKTTALLELATPEKLVAIDQSERRLERVKENIIRAVGELPDYVTIEAADASLYESDTLFDKILLDVPCSATGILHRHPDIKRLRKESDIAELAKTQQAILQHAWTLLKPGGRLLYATCSVLKEENEAQLYQFMEGRTDAISVPIKIDGGEAQHYGVQILPVYLDKAARMDGFYYALLEKKA